MSHADAEAGFTLLEMLVALAIFSLAAFALLRLQGATASNVAIIHDQAIAQMVARNIAVEALSDPLPPTMGTTSGQSANAGGDWFWTRTVEPSPEPRIQAIRIEVRSAFGRERAELLVFRRAEQPQ